MSVTQLKIVPRLSIRNQARLAVAKDRAAKAGSRALTNAEIAKVDDLTIFETVNGEVRIDNYRPPSLTWRHVLDCKVSMNRAGAAARAKDAGYRFFAYEGEIFFVSYRGVVEATGYAVEDVERGE